VPKVMESLAQRRRRVSLRCFYTIGWIP